MGWVGTEQKGKVKYAFLNAGAGGLSCMLLTATMDRRTFGPQCSYWIGGSWIGAGFTLVCFGLDLKLLWIGSEVSGAPGAPKHITHPVIAHRFEAERVGT